MLKNVVVVAFVIALSAGLAQAAELTAGPTFADPVVVSMPDVFLPNITQSTDPATIAGGTVACGVSGAHTRQNQWLRRFFLNTDHGIVLQYDVTSVDWAIGTVTLLDPGATDPVGTVNVYALANGAGFTYANMGAALGTADVTLIQSTVGTIVNFPATGSIVTPAATDLVVEIVMPDGAGTTVATDLWEVRAGDNALGELRDSYIAAADCGIIDPTTHTAISFPTAMLVLTVNGNEVPVELMTFSVE